MSRAGRPSFISSPVVRPTSRFQSPRARGPVGSGQSRLQPGVPEVQECTKRLDGAGCVKHVDEESGIREGTQEGSN
eukprot:2672575-Pyramimonas_sp.AAC.1